VYSNFTKPLLDLILFSRELSRLVGYSGPLTIIVWYGLSGVILKAVSPSIGKMTALA